MNKSYLLEALLRYNYLPIQKNDRSELPPLLSSFDLTPKIARGLISVNKRGQQTGWDSVEYQVTRYNGVTRILSIPHPLAYASLCLCIHDNWGKIDYCSRSSQSMVKPRQHPDGRTIIMDYEKSHPKQVKLSFGMRFQVKTDISNFFPSIYSHAVTWAAVGFAHAKANQKRQWFNDFDKKIRHTNRNETQGVAIGPATSNVIAEVILAKLDAEMDALGFKFIRYIDDYTAYCESYEKAEEFIQVLGEKLREYKLLLNIRKTSIKRLPCTDDGDEWIPDLVLSLPQGEINEYTAVRFLEKAQAVATQMPDGSVLKYAIKALLGRKLKLGVEYAILPQIINLSFYNPVLLPLLNAPFIRSARTRSFAFGENLHIIATENARLRRSDGLCWSMFYLNLYKAPIQNELADAVIDSRDCLAMLLLYLSGDSSHRAKVVSFVQTLDHTDLYKLDQYWILLYELFCEDTIQNFYQEEGAFTFLKSRNVRFVLPPFRGSQIGRTP